MCMDSFIDKELEDAHDKLESGLEYNKPQLVHEAISTYKLWKPSRRKECKQKILRGLTGLCVLDPAGALGYLEEAMKLDDNDATVLNNLGYVYHRQFNDFDKACSYYQLALKSDPKFERAYLGLLDIYRTLRLAALELQFTQQGVEQLPSSCELWNARGLAVMYSDRKNPLTEAKECFEKALSLEASGDVFSKVLMNVGHLSSVQGSVDDAIGSYMKAIQQDPKNKLAYSNLLLNIHYVTLFSRGQHFKALCKQLGLYVGSDQGKLNLEIHKQLTALAYGDGAKAPEACTPSAGQPIVVGFLGADFIGHAVSYFTSAVLKGLHADPTIRVIVYSNTVYDQLSISKVPCTAFKCIKDVPAEMVCQTIRLDKVSVLIDLSGHTAGNRLDVIALRPCSNILSYCGYPNDLGFSFCRRISDQFTESGFAKSNTVDLDRVFLCYTPPDGYSDIPYKDWKGYKPHGIVTLGCFGKLPKVNDDIVSLWCSVLRAYPRTRFLLKSKYFSDENVKKQWKGRFGDLSSRLVLLKGTETPAEHMRQFSAIDLHLDTWPYSGTTITTESLYMNVPVMTLCQRGDPHVSRVSADIIRSIGLEDELVAKTRQEYVVKVGKVIRRLDDLRVRERLLASTFMDAKDMGAKFSALMHKIVY